MKNMMLTTALLTLMMTACNHGTKNETVDQKLMNDSALNALSVGLYDPKMSQDSFEMLYNKGLNAALAIKKSSKIYAIASAKSIRFLNQKDTDGYIKETYRLIDFLKTNDKENHRYLAWQVHGNRLLDWGRYSEALEVVKEIGDCARKEHSETGIAYANMLMGDCYFDNDQMKEAVTYYMKAKATFQKEQEHFNVIRCTNNLISYYMEQHNYQKALGLLGEIPPQIVAWEKDVKMTNPVLRFSYARYRLEILYAMNNKPGVDQARDSMVYWNNVYADTGKQTQLQYSLFHASVMDGDMAAAQQYIDTLINQYRQNGDYAMLAHCYREMAEIYHQQGDDTKSAKWFTIAVTANDSAQSHSSLKQLNRLTKQYKLNELQQQRHAARLTALFFATLALAVIIVCLLLWRQSKALRRKNEALYLTIKQREQTEEAKDKLMTLTDDDPDADDDRKKYRELCKLMWDEKLFKLQIDRKDLSNRVGTNTVYLADIIKKYHDGMTIMEFINHFRLRYAAKLLTDRLDLSITAVGDDSGFNSRSTFNRLFRNYYGMTPGEYRSVSQDNHLFNTRNLSTDDECTENNEQNEYKKG